MTPVWTARVSVSYGDAMTADRDAGPADAPSRMAPPALEATLELIRRAQRGEAEAREQLCERYLPRIRRWAHGRLPAWARRVQDSQDVAILTMAKAVERVGRFEERGEAGFRALVWKILLDTVADMLRKAYREPVAEELPETIVDPAASAVEGVLVGEILETLDEEDRGLVLARLFLGCSYREVAERAGLSEDAARMRIGRALARVARGPAPGGGA